MITLSEHILNTLPDNDVPEEPTMVGLICEMWDNKIPPCRVEKAAQNTETGIGFTASPKGPGPRQHHAEPPV